MASGFPDRVPAWYTGAERAPGCDMTSAEDPKAPTGRPPPMTLPKHHTSGVTPDHSVAPPTAEAEPGDDLVEQQQGADAVALGAQARPGTRRAGGTSPMLAATGSTQTTATVSSRSGTTL